MLRRPHLVVLVLTLSASVLAAAPAAALSCGDFVVGVQSLTGDLHCTSGRYALTLAAGATLDLAGYTLSGPSSLGGVRVIGDNATIEGPGKVEGFWVGVNTSPPIVGLLVEQVTFVQTGAGIYLSHTSSSEVTGNQFLNLGSVAVSLRTSPFSSAPTENNRVADNLVQAALYGVELCGDTTRGNVVENNQILAADYGLLLHDHTNGNELYDNSVEHSSIAGVAIQSSWNNLLWGGLYRFNPTGVWITTSPLGSCHLDPSGTTDAWGNRLVGLSAFDNGIGVLFGGVGGGGLVVDNLFTRSKAYDNGTGADLRSDSAWNTVRDNAFHGSTTPILDTGVGNVTTPNSW